MALEPPGVVLVKKHNRPCGPLMATGSWSTPRLNAEQTDATSCLFAKPDDSLLNKVCTLFCDLTFEVSFWHS